MDRGSWNVDRGPIRAIFFDFDGVLVASEPVHYECWAEVLAGYGMPLTEQFYFDHFVGISNQEMIEVLCRRYGRAHSREFFQECYARKKALYATRVLEACRTPDDLAAFIRSQAATYRLGVVSSSARSEVEPLLVRDGLRESLAALVCGSENVKNLKPAPDPYLHALELVNAGAANPLHPQECLVVEDSGPGEKSGRLAGMRVLRVTGPEEVSSRLRHVLRVG
ncbi:MAG: HAD family phosphatase [Acidobacteria bacterium]|nr:HAD family phosphatase [Acidobacteriota bacterium]